MKVVYLLSTKKNTAISYLGLLPLKCLMDVYNSYQNIFIVTPNT